MDGQSSQDAGHTILVIKHHFNVVKTADHVIDLGSDGGNEGGCVVAQGTPEEVAGVAGSHTGRYLVGALSEAAAQTMGFTPR